MLQVANSWYDFYVVALRIRFLILSIFSATLSSEDSPPLFIIIFVNSFQALKENAGKLQFVYTKLQFAKCNKHKRRQSYKKEEENKK